MNFQRLEYLIGKNNLNKLSQASVAIIGLGGVGGVSALTLARNGVGNILIQDFDLVEESNINRQIIANYATIGKSKVDLVEEEIKKINPNCNIIKLNQAFNEESSLFNYRFTYLIDAIDSLDAKYLLIKSCLKKKIHFISAMGAAKKTDMTKLRITELSKTTHDPLARILRKRLRDAEIYDKIVVASSTEEASIIPNLGSYMPVTASMGLMLADYILKEIMKE